MLLDWMSVMSTKCARLSPVTLNEGQAEDSVKEGAPRLVRSEMGRSAKAFRSDGGSYHKSICVNE